MPHSLDRKSNIFGVEWTTMVALVDSKHFINAVLGHSRQPRLNVLTLRPILPDMPRKPQQPPQPTKTKWHVYKLAAKRQWVGEIEAVDENEGIENDEQELNKNSVNVVGRGKKSKSLFVVG